nr:SPOR domain-containing protein [Thermoflexibacter sp.]
MIEKYIKELLLTQDKVVVPNLGTFTSSFSPAKMSADGNTIIPPHKALTFSIYIREEDKNDDLMKVVMKGENTGYYDFNEKLLAFVEQVQQSIIANGQYEMKEIGTLVKDAHNKIVLLQDNHQSFLGDSFGLPPIDTVFVEKEIEKITIPEVKTLDKIITEEKPTATPKEILEKEEQLRQEVLRERQEGGKSNTASIKKDVDSTAKGGRKSDLMWWLAVIPLVFLFTFLVYLFTSPEAMRNFKAFFGSEKEVSADMNTLNQNTEENNTNLSDSLDNTSDNSSEINPIDNQPSEISTDKEIKSEKEKTPVNNETPKVNESDTEENLTIGKFYLVYGSFSSKNGAEKARKTLTDKGLNTKLLFLSSKNMYRVVIGDFESHADATNKKTELGSEFSQTWV